MSNLKDVLQQEPMVVQLIHGVSMLPLLRQGKDSVVLTAKKQRLQPLDVALYVRPNDGAYVLHRVIEQTLTGYVIRGDNCYSDEIVEEDSVIGVMTGYFRDEEYVSVQDMRYLSYAKRRVQTYPRRQFWRKVSNKIKQPIKSLWHKIFKKNKSKT